MTSSPGDAPRQSGGEPRATTEGGGAPEERVRTARGRTRCGFRPRTGSQRSSRRPCASPIGREGRRCAHGRPRTYPLARCCAPPTWTAIATSFLVFRARKATRAIISVVGGRLRVFSPRVSLFAPPRLSPWPPFPPLALPARGAPSLPCALRNLDFSVLEIFNVS